MSNEQNTISIAEFKTWLEGAEAFQGPDWTPDSKQWKIIREKIDNLVDAPSASYTPRAPSHSSSFPPLAQSAPITSQQPPPTQNNDRIKLESSGFAQASTNRRSNTHRESGDYASSFE